MTKTDDIRFMLECITADLVAMLIEEYGWDKQRALDELYASETFRRLCNPATGLYYESPLYVFSFLQNEIEKGEVA